MVRPRLPIPRLLTASQKRWQTLVRKEDSEGNVYYTLFNKRRDPNKPASLKEVTPFQISNLLLDLDQFQAKGVKDFSEEHEAGLRQQYGTDKSEKHVAQKLEEFKNQFESLKQRTGPLMADVGYPWVINHSDLLSVALLGAPPEEAIAAQIPIELKKRHNAVDELRTLNGIPAHAAKEDQSLIEWMFRRHEQVEDHSRDRKFPQAYAAFEKNIKHASSVMEIRRLVSRLLHFLDDPKDLELKSKGQHLAILIRKQCNLVVLHSSSRIQEAPAALIFLGNFVQRMERMKMDIRSIIYPLALQLTGTAGLVGPTFDYIAKGFEAGLWDGSPENEEAIYATLDGYKRHIRAGLEANSKQFLLQLLTGLDENSALTNESFRTLAGICPNPRVFQNYIQVLRELGAKRTVCQEARLFGKDAHEDRKDVVAAALKSTEQSILAECETMSFEEAILKDYQDLGAIS